MYPKMAIFSPPPCPGGKSMPESETPPVVQYMDMESFIEWN